LNTKAEKSLAYGPGLLTDQVCGTDSIFIIQSRDEEGKNRTSGRDEYHVIIKRTDNDEVIPSKIEDMNNGT